MKETGRGAGRALSQLNAEWSNLARCAGRQKQRQAQQHRFLLFLVNPSHVEDKKGLTRWEVGADFSNEFMAPLTVIISREEKVGVGGHRLRGQVNQSISVSHF